MIQKYDHIVVTTINNDTNEHFIRAQENKPMDGKELLSYLGSDAFFFVCKLTNHTVAYRSCNVAKIEYLGVVERDLD